MIELVAGVFATIICLKGLEREAMKSCNEGVVSREGLKDLVLGCEKIDMSESGKVIKESDTIFL